MPTYNSHFTFIPKFQYDDVSGVDFGGFIVDKFVNSQPGASVGVGNPESVNSPLSDGAKIPSVSLAGVPVWDNVSFCDAMIVCANRGQGWHLMSGTEASTLSYLSKNFNIQPQGNTGGTSNPPDNYYDSDEKAVADGEVTGRALTGTGNLNWSQNKIFDLVGLTREWTMMLMGSVNYTSPGTLFLPANTDITYLGSPYGRGVFKTNADTNFERVYSSAADLSQLSVGDSITDVATGTVSAQIVAIDDDNDYVYARVTTGSFANKSNMEDTTAGVTVGIDGAAGTGATGIDSMVSMICNDTNTAWDKQWSTNDFVGNYMFIAESTDSGELVTIYASTTSEIIFDSTSNIISNFTLDDYITFCIFESQTASDITGVATDATWHYITSLYTNSTIGPFSIMSATSATSTIFNGKQYFKYSTNPDGTSSGNYVACESFGGYSDQGNSGIFTRVFNATPDYKSNLISFRACKAL